MDEMLLLGAAELARRIRRRRVTPAEVVEAHITRIEAVNPAINALVTARFDDARAEARRATEKLASGAENLPPLFGVPVTIKDALAVAGLRFTAGSTLFQDRVADRDAEAVRRLRAAGAIILGKSNCPDMSSSVETNNLVFGRTRNPWDLARATGGSSGGEGALIAAGGSPLGLGSDVAGSIRIPAAFCGVCGLKPTGGRVSTDGHEPQVPASIHDWLTVGPLGRRVEDLALALAVLSETPVQPHGEIEIVGRRLVVPSYLSTMPVNGEVKGAVTRAAAALRQAGMEVVEKVKLPLLRASFEVGGIVHREWFPTAKRELAGGRPLHVGRELLLNWRGRGRIAPNVLAMMQVNLVMGRLSRVLGFGRPERLEALREEVLAAIGEGGLLLWPVYAAPARRHGFSWGPYGSPSYTVVFNGLRLPSVAVPAGWTAGGLPLGVQIVARPGEDEIALAAASAVEAALGGWRPCESV